MRAEENLVVIVAPWKFDVLKSSILALEAANIWFKNIKFPRGNYQPIVPRQKHSILFNYSTNARVSHIWSDCYCYLTSAIFNIQVFVVPYDKTEGNQSRD